MHSAHPTKKHSAIPVFNSDKITAAIREFTEAIERVSVTTEEGLARVVEAVEENIMWEQYMRRRHITPLDATGAGTIQLVVPLGFAWILQRVTVTSTQNGLCQFYVDTTNPQDMVEVIGNSQLYSDAFKNTIFVPGGSNLYAVFSGAGANGQATINMQLRVIKEHPFHNVHRRHS